MSASNQFVVAADVNGDSNVDLVCANYTSSTLSVFTNNGNGIFSSNATYVVGTSPFSVTVADIYGTGKPCLISANYNPTDTLTVLTNNGSGVFGSNTTISAVGVGVESVTASDINGSGKLALIVASYYGHGLTVLTNNGAGHFIFSAFLNSGTTVSWGTAADVNGDGKVDLITANNNADTLTIFTNNGSGSFGSNTTVNVGTYPIAVVAADLNQDGGQDLIAVNTFDNDLSVLLNSAVYALKIKRSGSSTSVTWPSIWANWTLQQNTNLATTNWVASSSVLDDGTTKSFTASAPKGNLFFRLMQ
jgi:hypothetical protein